MLACGRYTRQNRLKISSFTKRVRVSLALVGTQKVSKKCPSTSTAPQNLKVITARLTSATGKPRFFDKAIPDTDWPTRLRSGPSRFSTWAGVKLSRSELQIGRSSSQGQKYLFEPARERPMPDGDHSWRVPGTSDFECWRSIKDDSRLPPRFSDNRRQHL
jgi:hypothetical protein